MDAANTETKSETADMSLQIGEDTFGFYSCCFTEFVRS
jgi:hypothetical protein